MGNIADPGKSGGQGNNSADALSGLLIVSIEQAVAAPYATSRLAEAGARVIKIEKPPAGDFARQRGDVGLAGTDHEMIHDAFSYASRVVKLPGGEQQADGVDIVFHGCGG